MMWLTDHGDGMNSGSRPAVAMFLVVLLVTSIGTLGSATGTSRDVAGNETAAGERLTGFVSAEQVSVTGEVERARFERDFQDAQTDEGQAATVATYLNRSRDRLDALEQRERGLHEALENGSLTRSEYNARAARIGARAEALARLAERLANASAELPPHLRRQHGIEQTDIRRLHDSAVALADRTRGDRADADGALYSDIARMIDAYNSHLDRGESSIVREQLHGERVNLYVESPDSPVVAVSFRVDDTGRIVETRAGPRGDATIRMETDRRTVRQLSTADDPAATFQRAISNDDVQIEGIGTLSNLKWKLVDLVAPLFE